MSNALAMSLLPAAPAARRLLRRALVIAGAVGLMHACTLLWVSTDLGPVLVDDSTPSSFEVALVPPPRVAPPPEPAAPRATAPRARPAAAPAAEAAPEPAPEPAPTEGAAEAPQENATDAPGAEGAGESLRSEAGPASLPLPPSGRLVYGLAHSAYPGATARTVVEWNFDADRASYEIRMLASVGGFVLAGSRSIGQIADTGLVPLRYTQRTATRAETAVNFDWAGLRVTYSASRAEHPIPPGVQDPISVQFQVPVLAMRHPEHLQPGARLPVQVARPNRIDQAEFTVIGRESVRSAAGQPIDTVKLEARKGEGSEQGWEFWLAPEHYWMPVRIRLVDRRGQVWDNVLASLPGTPEPGTVNDATNPLPGGGG
ncbi:MAG: hypothetical protein RL669_83 [Pseudomonadota bacterium]